MTRQGSGELRRLARGLLAAGVGGLFLALSGAFGTLEAPLWRRLAYWLPVMLAGGLWGHLTSILIRRFVELDDRPWAHVGLLTALISGPVTLFVWLVTGPVFGDGVYPLRTLPLMFLPVVTITGVMSLANVFLTRQLVETHAAPPDAAPARFLDRLPARLKGASLRAVEAEDHYLRVHTDRGSDLILFRLSDALIELEGLEGAQVHRSWWVARDAIRDIARGDGRAVLTLDGGLTVPVSRRHARALRAAGWW